jgi:hypothetical protein
MLQRMPNVTAPNYMLRDQFNPRHMYKRRYVGSLRETGWFVWGQKWGTSKQIWERQKVVTSYDRLDREGASVHSSKEIGPSQLYATGTAIHVGNCKNLP